MPLHVRDVDEEERTEMGTYRVVGAGFYQRAVPDVSKKDRTTLEMMALPALEPEVSDFAPFMRPGTRHWEEFFSTRKVVEREMADGTRLAAVTSSLADVLDSRSREHVGGGRGRSFLVAQLLTDLSLIDKFHLTGDFRADLRNSAVLDTNRAAAKLQAHIRRFEGYEKAVVSAGQYGYSWKAARDRLKQEAARFSVVSVSVNANLIGDKIFIYGEGQDEDGWRIMGPLSCAPLVRMVHQMVQASSGESVAFALGPELTILDIDVCVGHEVLSPVRERHAGNHDELPQVNSQLTSERLSVRTRDMLVKACSAVSRVSLDGLDCASGIRISKRFLLANAHVVGEKGELQVAGRPAYAHKMLSRDMWLVRQDGPDVLWHMRPAAVGEEVVLCYSRHDEIFYTEPVEVLSADSDVLTLKKCSSMVPGMSGAAVVALSDMALLGQYDGVTVRRAVCSAFTPEMYTEICTAEDLEGESHASAREEPDSVYSSLKQRGLGRVADEAMASVVPLYCGSMHVGMGLSVDKVLYTVCDPDLGPLTIGGEGQPLVFRSGPDGYVVADMAGHSRGPAVCRKPTYGETVFVVGKDAAGDYYSHSAARVTHVGLNSAVFELSGLDLKDALPLQGGLVVSHSDAAVIGVLHLARRSGNRGQVAVCRAIPDLEVVTTPKESAAEGLQRLFPFLRTKAWPEGLAESAVTHKSTSVGLASGMDALAMVGDSAMRTLLWTKLHEAGMPPSRWQEAIQRLQSNAALAETCGKFKLDELLKAAKGVVALESRKVRADLLEAIAGAIYIADSVQAFEAFCEHVGCINLEAGFVT